MAASTKVTVVWENEEIRVSRSIGPSRKYGRTLIDRRQWRITFKPNEKYADLGAVDAGALAAALSESMVKESS